MRPSELLSLFMVLLGIVAPVASKLAQASRGAKRKQRRLQEQTTFESFFNICYITDGSGNMDLTQAAQTLAVTYNNLVNVGIDDPFERRMIRVDVMEVEGRRKLSDEEIRNLQFNRLSNLNVFLRVVGSCFACPTRTRFTNQVEQPRRMKSSKSGKGKGSSVDYPQSIVYADESEISLERDGGDVVTQPSNNVGPITIDYGTVQTTENGYVQPVNNEVVLPVDLATSQPLGGAVVPTDVVQPSSTPSALPSLQPSSTPSSKPSVLPSLQPSSAPSVPPSVQPSSSPSDLPSTQPSPSPSVSPSVQPSLSPSVSPSVQPSLPPSVFPSVQPSLSPSVLPLVQPSLTPSIWTVPSITVSSTPTVFVDAQLVKNEDDQVTNAVDDVVDIVNPTDAATSLPETNPTVLSTIPTEEELRIAYAEELKKLDCHILDVLSLLEVIS